MQATTTHGDRRLKCGHAATQHKALNGVSASRTKSRLCLVPQAGHLVFLTLRPSSSMQGLVRLELEVGRQTSNFTHWLNDPPVCTHTLAAS